MHPKVIDIQQNSLQLVSKCFSGSLDQISSQCAIKGCLKVVLHIHNAQTASETGGQKKPNSSFFSLAAPYCLNPAPPHHTIC